MQLKIVEPIPEQQVSDTACGRSREEKLSWGYDDFFFGLLADPLIRRWIFESGHWFT